MKRTSFFNPYFVLIALLTLVSLALWLGVFPPWHKPHGVRVSTPLGAMEFAIEKSVEDRSDGIFPGYYRIGFFAATGGYTRRVWGVVSIARTRQYFHNGDGKRLRSPMPVMIKSLFGQHLCWGFPQATISFGLVGGLFLLFRWIRLRNNETKLDGFRV